LFLYPLPAPPAFDAFSHSQQPRPLLAAQQLKLALAHIALHYDIQPLPVRPRPANRWIVGSSAPLLDAVNRVRRRWAREA
jgi:hypothetical protein